MGQFKARQYKRGITLVELLTVIVIISVLIGILLPAFNLVREAGRIAVCTDHQRQLSQAVLQYETQKNHLPGVMGQLQTSSGTTQVNWAQTLLPFMGSQDIWNQIQSGGKPAVRVDLLWCTDDSYLKANPTTTPLTYVLNYQPIANSQSTTGQWTFLDYRQTPPVNSAGTVVTPLLVSKMPAAARTVMLAENSIPNSTYHPGPWGGPTPAMTYQSLTISGPTTAPAPLVSSIPNFISPHGSVVVMSFFDGHQEKVSTDANFPTP